jgi:hypothetical protein
VTVHYPSLEDYLHTAAFVLDLPVETAAPGADLEAVEAEVAAWITERLHQRK